ncbi:protein like protein 1 [Ilyonectria robusta]
MFRPHGAPRVCHLRPLAPSSAASKLDSVSTAIAAVSTVPALAPVARAARVVDAPQLGDGARQAPSAAAHSADSASPAHEHAHDDVPRLTLRPWRPLLHSLRPSRLPGLSGHLWRFLPPASPHCLLQARGNKTKTTVKLSDLPQGLIQPRASQLSSPSPPLDPLPQDELAYPTVVLQARRNMRKFENCVLLTRVGGFYELYFEHADDYGPLLNLKVATKKTNAGPVPMDVPLGLAWLDLSTGRFGTQQTNLASLPSILSRLCPRELVLDQDLESNPHHPVFPLLADDRHLITYSPQGDLLSPSDWTPMLEAPLPTPAAAGFSPEEVLAVGLVLNYVKDRLQGASMKLQPPLRHENMQIMAIDKNSLRALEVKQTIRDGAFRGCLLHAIRRTVTKSGARLLNEWLSAPSTSLDVITARQDLVAHFISDADLRDSVILLLRRSHDSQRLVQKFALGRGDADDLIGLANTITATRDIVTLLQDAPSVADAPTPDCLASLTSRISLTEPVKLARRIKAAIDEDGIVQQHQAEDSEASQMIALAEDIVSSEGSPEDAAALPKGKRKRPTSIREYYADDNEAWIMKPAASRTLKRLHAELNSLLQEKGDLNETLCERTGAPSLTLRWTPGLGHIAHVKGKDVKNFTDVMALSASRSTRSFHLPEWTALGRRLDQVRVQIRAEEQNVFHALRENVVRNLVKLRRNAAVLDELDVATSFAKLALEQSLVRPTLNNTTCHTIVGGRHPTVEGGLFEQGRSFVSNDCLVGSPTDGRIWLITGPNMAGKSTFLRQNALITILAQIGCYVPASYAEIGIVDAIFSRVGSADNLYRDQSTFMVEMLETAQILKHATPRSFVIMDEIGRGTTPEDGTAVAFACLHHLATVNQCRTLFATHFHQVADLAATEGLCDGNRGTVHTYCTDVEEDGEGGFVYVHKLRKGINRESHALKVARLAGLPERAIGVARQVLNHHPMESAGAGHNPGRVGTG